MAPERKRQSIPEAIAATLDQTEPLSARLGKRLRDICRTDAPTIRDDADVDSIEALLSTGEQQVIVVDGEGRALGAVTRESLDAFRRRSGGRGPTHALDAASAGVVFLRDGERAQSAAERVLPNPAARCILVVDEGGYLMGTLAESDLAAADPSQVWEEAETLPGEPLPPLSSRSG